MKWIVGDTEATGLGPEARVCEIAWAEIDEDTLQVVDRQHSLIDPQCRISASSSGVHGITNMDVAEAPTIEEFFQIVYGQKIAGPCVLIAHNAKFDEPFFAPWINGLAGVMCTLRLARLYLKEAEDWKLQTLKFQYGLAMEESHSAAGDVSQTVDLLRILVKRSGLTLSELMAESLKPIYIEKWPFGKYGPKGADGHQLLTHDKGYCRWALGPKGMTDMEPDLRWSIEQALAGTAPV